MKKTFCALLACSAFYLATPALADLSDLSTVDVSAVVEVKAVPDVALISAGIMTTAPTAAGAMQDNATGMAEVYAALKTAGVDEKDIQTSGISVNAQYAYQDGRAPRVTGYQATNNVNITLRDMAAAGKTIDTLVASGANQINGPSFSVDEPEALLDKARAEAVRKAAKRAALYATAAGMQVKRLVTISEQTLESAPQPRMMMKAMAMDSAASTPVSPGQVTLSVTVNARYELTP